MKPFTKEQSDAYLNYHNWFVARCQEISEIFQPICEDYAYCKNATDWTIKIWDNTKIIIYGNIETNYCMGEFEHYNVEFPFDYLTKSNDELKQIVQLQLDEREKENEKLRKKTEELTEQRERAELERLKNKYENSNK